MKTSRKLVPLFLSIFLLVSCVVKGGPAPADKERITRNCDVANFHAIDVSAVGNVCFTQSAEGVYSVSIEGPKYVVETMTVSVENETLHFGLSKRISNINGVTIRISSPRLDDMNFSGVGNFEIPNGLKTTTLNLELKGVGEVNIKALSCDKLTANVRGTGSMKLEGQTQRAEFGLYGVGDIQADNLEASHVEAATFGIGNISCHAKESIKMDKKGMGSIKYKGNPTVQ